MKQIYNIATGMLVVILFGCRQNTLQYDPALLDNAPQIEAAAETVVSDIKCRYPIQISVLDSMIIVLDAGANDGFFHIYSDKGQLIAAFGKRGRGYGELIDMPASFSVDGHAVFVADKNKIVGYDLSKLLAGKGQYISQLSYSELFKSQEYTFQDVIVCDSTYFCFRISPESRMTVVSPAANLLVTYNTLPALDISDKTTVDDYIVWRYMTRSCLSPDRRHLAQSTYIGAVIDLLEITSDNDIRSIATRYILPPKYQKIDSNNIMIADDTFIGFDVMCCTNEYVYGLINGNTGKDLRNREIRNPYTRKVAVFDWNGNVAGCIHTPYMMTAIDVAQDNRTGYAVAYKDGIYDLMKMNWQLKTE